MATPGADSPQWLTVDEGWGRRAADFSTLSEPGNCVPQAKGRPHQHHQPAQDAVRQCAP